MPLLMDEDLDDLFGDHGGDPSLQLPSSISKELLQHVDNLRLTGCCQYVSSLDFINNTEARMQTHRLVQDWMYRNH